MKNFPARLAMTAASFAGYINRTISGEGASVGCIQDGRLEIDYPGLGVLVDAIADYLEKMEVSRNECIACEIDDSIPAIALVLCLVSEGYDVLFVPASSSEDNRSDPIDRMPSFIRRYLKFARPVTCTNDSENILRDPASFLQLNGNKHFYESSLGLGSHAPSLLMRTSGTTGEAKYVVHEKARLLRNVLACVERFQLRSIDRVLIAAPICHMYGLAAALLPSVLTGSSICLIDKPNILKILDAERSFRPNVAFITPTVGEMLLRSSKAPTTYERAVSAGDRLKEDTFMSLERRFGCMINLYGSTEMGAIASNCVGDSVEEKHASVGQPLNGVELKLDGACDVPSQAELYCRSADGFLGYVDSRGKPINDTGPAFSQGWLATRDIAAFTDGGSLRIVGRANLSANRAGKLVTFSEIEKKIERLDAVKRAVLVAGENDSIYGTELIALCILEDGISATEKTLRQACSKALPKRLLPERFLIVADFPYLKSGKLDREKLKSIPELEQTQNCCI